MPTTANFSLEYPDDNSSVDIAGHFETLADDVDEAINTRLALTGGTLTGSLSGTSLSLSSTLSVAGATTLTGDLTISKASATHTIGSSSGTTNVNLDSVAGTYKYLNFRTGTSVRWTLGTTATAESGSNAGTDLFIGRSSDGGAYIDAPLTITRSTGAMTLSGDVTVSKTSNLISTITTSSGYALNFIASPPGQLAGTFLRTSGAHRWAIVKTEAAESGSNAGSDLVIKNYNDDGSVIGSPLTITRSTGAVTLTGDLTMSKASPFLTVYATSGNSYVLVNRPAGSVGGVALQTNNATRWLTSVTNTAESGSNAGSDFAIAAYNDAGALLSTPLTITRSTGAVTLTGNVLIEKASPILKIDSTSGHAALDIERPAGSHGYIYFKTAGYGYRWIVAANGTTESGSNAGSDFTIARYSDAAAFIDTPLTITRSTGAVTLTGDLTISKASPVLSINASSGDPVVSIDGAAGQIKSTRYRTGTSLRWLTGANATAESGSNAGSDFVIQRYNDAGAGLGAALTITRSTGAVTLTGTLNGKVVDDLVTGPASATDNALVRFDNTTGKVVQNSGITVDDSGYITSDVTMSKASPILSVSASTTTTASIYFDNAAAGSYGRFLFRVNGSKRWECGRDGTAEAGANAGSDFYISNYSDASAAIGIPFKIARSTGKTTLGYVGATAGLELGTSGPRVMSGTGSPEGVVTAPVGSTWIRTDGATLGDFRYSKQAGTGNTGWVVSEGDTGWRNVTASMEAAFKTSNPNCTLYARRTNDRVTWMLNETIAGSATGTVVIYVPPTGFKETVGGIPVGVHCINANTGTGLNETFYFASGTTLYGFAWTAIRHQALLSYPLASSTAWPTSLPGSAA